jgi:hypothetical protein
MAHIWLVDGDPYCNDIDSQPWKSVKVTLPPQEWFEENIPVFRHTDMLLEYARDNLAGQTLELVSVSSKFTDMCTMINTDGDCGPPGTTLCEDMGRPLQKYLLKHYPQFSEEIPYITYLYYSPKRN